MRLKWLLAALICCLPLNSARADEQPLDLRRVVMFSSGVAFYEHRGQVEDDAEVELKFNVDDINDMLKSMVLQDLDGGSISTITYGSREPITRTLGTFSIDLTNNPSLAGLLMQVRGEKIEIEAPNLITGVIVGVEQKQKKIDNDTVASVEVLNLLTDTGLRSIALDDVQRVKLLDKKLNDELQQALVVLAMGHAVDKKTVTLKFLGNGQRDVRVGYIQEAPVWKTSYRMVLDDDEAPYLQGWAIVENTTEMDWKDVELTLISGRPISFRMDLYQPLFVDRPVVEPELYASLRPQTYNQDLASAERDFRRAAQAPQAGGFGGGFAKAESNRLRQQGRGNYAAETKRKELADGLAIDGKSLKQSLGSGAQAGDVGELFQYAIENPVDLPRRQSAMLPIINESVQGEKVSIYNQNVQAKHPLNGLKLVNTSNLHLMQGPITVFDGGVYAGDAKIQDLAPGSSRLLSYALDLDTEVSPETKSQPEQIVQLKALYGNLYVTTKYRRSTKYIVKNSGSKEKKVLIEKPIDSNWDLASPKEPTEKTRDIYRFAVKAEPGVPTELTVTEERTVRNTYGLTNMSDDSIRLYMRADVMSDEMKKALEEIIDRKAKIAGVYAKRRLLEQRLQVIDREQDRIRENMKQLPRSGELYQRYVKKFGEQESQVESLREEIKELNEEANRLQKDLNNYIRNLKLD